MYQASDVFFLYAVSPVHMGAGTSIGVVDNPIQRERHTEHPILAGSGLKGAFRDFCRGSGENDWIDEVFGPEPGNASEHAGAVAFSDAQIVCFPVRSLRGAFVYATCPLALGRLARLVEAAGGPKLPAWPVPDGDKQACVASDQVLSGEKLVLEAFSFDGMPDGDAEAVGQWLAANAVPQGGDESCWGFFAERLKTHLVVLGDTFFDHFVRHSTVVEPHVRIDDETGTADKGGLFYTENLPPESLLVAAAFASRSRKKKDENDPPAAGAGDILGKVRESLDGALVQVGGDATTGRGQVFLRFLGGKEG